MTGVQTCALPIYPAEEAAADEAKAVAQEEKATANFVAEEAVKSDEVSEETSE